MKPTYTYEDEIFRVTIEALPPSSFFSARSSLAVQVFVRGAVVSRCHALEMGPKLTEHLAHDCWGPQPNRFSLVVAMKSTILAIARLIDLGLGSMLRGIELDSAFGVVLTLHHAPTTSDNLSSPEAGCPSAPSPRSPG